MTEYQRGNRDGLLSFAKFCDAKRFAELEQWHVWKDHANNLRIAERHASAADAWDRASKAARRAAKALPDEP